MKNFEILKFVLCMKQLFPGLHIRLTQDSSTKSSTRNGPLEKVSRYWLFECTSHVSLPVWGALNFGKSKTMPFQFEIWHMYYPFICSIKLLFFSTNFFRLVCLDYVENTCGIAWNAVIPWVFLTVRRIGDFMPHGVRWLQMFSELLCSQNWQTLIP